MSDRRNVAIIGAGIGAQHLEAFLALPERFYVAAICDLNADRARPLVAASPDARLETDMTEILSDSSIDIVDICLPPHLHRSAILAALDAGKPVICEKPLVSSLAELDEIEAAENRIGLRVFPVYQYRYGLGSRQLRALIDEGIAGKPFVATLETHWNRGTDYYAVPWRGTWAGERGGAVLGHAIHIHDWLVHIFGPVASVHAELDTRVNDIETEDCAALAIRMECGALVTSSITLGAANDTSRMRFCFQGLTAESGRTPYAPAEDNWTFSARAPVEQSEVDSVLATVDVPASGFVGLFTAIADSLDAGSASTVSLKDARTSLSFVTAVYGSVRTGAPVALPIDREHPLYADCAARADIE